MKRHTNEQLERVNVRGREGRKEGKRITYFDFIDFNNLNQR